MTGREEAAYSAIQNAIEAAIEKAAAECGGTLISLHNEITAALIDVLAYHHSYGRRRHAGRCEHKRRSSESTLYREDRHHPRKAERRRHGP